MFKRLFIIAGIAAVGLAAASTAAYAQAQPLTFSGNAWVALGIIVGLVALIAVLIGGVIGVSSRGETADDDGGGLPIFETDEDERRKRRR